MAMHKVDMAGKRYSSVTAICHTKENASRGLIWLFQCDCGKKFEASGSEVRRGKIKRCPDCAKKLKHQAVSSHGKTKRSEYAIWTAMKRRCLNGKSHGYADYGGRGIKVCERWMDSFENFYADMGPRPQFGTIERINNDGDYEPSNCRWATRAEQSNNKRNNRAITINGVTKNLSEWSRISGISEAGIRRRQKSGLVGDRLIAPVEFSETLVFNGERNTLAEWSKKTGIKKGTLSSRIYVYKWPLEKALTQVP